MQPESKYLLKRNSLILASYTFISSTSSPSHGIDWKSMDDGSLVHGWRNINPKHTFLSPGSARFRKFGSVIMPAVMLVPLCLFMSRKGFQMILLRFIFYYPLF